MVYFDGNHYSKSNDKRPNYVILPLKRRGKVTYFSTFREKCLSSHITETQDRLNPQSRVSKSIVIVTGVHVRDMIRYPNGRHGYLLSGKFRQTLSPSFSPNHPRSLCELFAYVVDENYRLQKRNPAVSGPVVRWRPDTPPTLRFLASGRCVKVWLGQIQARVETTSVTPWLRLHRLSVGKSTVSTLWSTRFTRRSVEPTSRTWILF